MFWAQYAGQGPQELPPEAAAMLTVFVIILIAGLFIALGVMAVCCYLYSVLLQRVPKKYRQMEPGMVWLLMIPLFNTIWLFFVVLRISDSYKRYFASKGNTTVGDCGYGIGLAFCICCCIGLFPGAIALYIFYLVKLFGLRNQIPEREAITKT